MVFRFKIEFDQDPEIYRVVEVGAPQSLELLMNTFLESIKFKTGLPFKWHRVDDQWHKEELLAQGKDEGKKKSGSASKELPRLNQLVDDPHEKFLWEYQDQDPWEFRVELLRLRKAQEGEKLPKVVQSQGKAPEQFAVNRNLSLSKAHTSDFELPDEMHDEWETDNLEESGFHLDSDSAEGKS